MSTFLLTSLAPNIIIPIKPPCHVDEANFVEDGSPVKKPKIEFMNLVSDCENSDDLFFEMSYLGGNWDTSSVDAFLNGDSVQLEPCRF
ncbi:hypothetical protein L2E82_08267 [Cichorium intybus]|uniref:Uncharacterized protein n=1 Tax=Cichorium intybus TaxID=13427 RepID=A0ACB9G631_CICIN|nr:hypothetical protein L2E82_08267 [Cichorium intybus]